MKRTIITIVALWLGMAIMSYAENREDLSRDLCFLLQNDWEQTSEGVEKARKLLEEGADPNFYGCPMYHAKSEEMITLLMKYGVNLNQCEWYGGTVLYSKIENYADAPARKWQKSSAIILMNFGAKTNGVCGGDSPFLMAISHNLIDLIHIMVEEHDTNINEHSSKDGRTALISVIKSPPNNKHKIPLIKYLLEHGADPDIPDNLGYTPMLYATYANYADVGLAIIKLLLEHDANVDFRAIIKAGWVKNSWEEFKEIADFLFDHGAILEDWDFPPEEKRRFYLEAIYVNPRNDIDLAALRGDFETAVQLVNDECNSWRPDKFARCGVPHSANHKRALIVAIMREKWEIVEFLAKKWSFQDKFIHPEEGTGAVEVLNWMTISGFWDNLVWLMRNHSLKANDLNAVIQFAFDENPEAMQALVEKLTH